MYCVDRTSSADFIFRLQPGDSQRFLPNAGTLGEYQVVQPDSWPQWGLGGDLFIANSGPPGQHGDCSQGHDYAGSRNEACGGENNWGETDLEAWRLPG